MTTDVHNLGNFASLAAAWEKYPNGAMVGDYIFIAGVRYDWDKYEKQWLTPVAVTDMNISVFDVSTYDFEANDWRHALPNGEYTVVSNTQAVGKLLKYDDGFVLEGFVTLTEAGADKVFSPVVDGGKPKADAKILSGNQSYHKYVYVDSKGVYNVSDATEIGQIGDIQHHLDDLQQYVDDNLNSLNKAVSAIKKDVGTTEDEADKEGSLHAQINYLIGQIGDIQHHLDDLQQYVDDNLNSLNKAVSAIKKDVGTTEDEADKEGSLHAQINYLKQNGGSCDCEEILEYDKALVTVLTPDSTSEEISLAFVPIGAKDKTTPVLPKVNDLLVTKGNVKEMAQFVNVTDYLTPKGTHRYTLIYQDGSILHTIQMLGFTSVHSVAQNDLADFSEVELVPTTI